MSVALTDEQVTQVTTSTSTRYSKEEWKAYLAKVAAAKKSVGRCEADFPGVKPAHVRYMFKSILKANPELAKQLVVGTHPQLGVVLKVASS